MKRSKSLDQVLSIDAIALNHITKLHNKNKIQGTILEKLVNFASSAPDFRRLNNGNYCCPVKIYKRNKIRADTSHEVSALLVIFVFAKK